jgi:hypothetical protein
MTTQSLEIKAATRKGVKPLIGLYSESGCGKTYSALFLARGFVGPTGKIVLIDTESGRGSLYADVLPGGYDVLELYQPFTPARYSEAITKAEDSGAGILVVDSASHEWEGSGGVLDMASEREAASGKAGLHNWKQPKMEHGKFMLRLLQSRLPIIVCLRAKHKTRQGKDEKGRTAIIKDEFTTPIQADDFIFEMTAHAEILKDHSINLTKCSHPSLRTCFPASGPISEEHGRLLAQWCNNPGKPVNGQPANNPLKVKLWEACKPIRGDLKNWDTAEAWMVAAKILKPGQTVSTLTDDELLEALDKTSIELTAN